jgi:hypothetical protein
VDSSAKNNFQTFSDLNLIKRLRKKSFMRIINERLRKRRKSRAKAYLKLKKAYSKVNKKYI